MPKFRTAYDISELCSVSGDAFEPEYSARYDDTGTLVLEIVGKRDVYSEIQSYKESVDINNILARYSRGETDVLSKIQGFYSDISDMPNTYQDCLNYVIKTEQFFEALPVSEKEKFNNSFSEFMVKLGDPDYWKSQEKPPAPVPDDGDDNG